MESMAEFLYNMVAFILKIKIDFTYTNIKK